ncbi:hypothetical protein TELCIR_10763 [Teladorsagia circumcincta]|uniref:RRM domain-containing protein n=1 Tax=Teladorsagia circumcincta TaxID=45464 RepID=A0A2G9UB73_TELCI|nr:hypothetical protein TELCIR_10763 [Teladorsagia circumcincta]
MADHSDSHKAKKAKSATNTPVHAKPLKRAKHEEESDDDEDEEVVAPEVEEEDSDEMDEDEEEDEESEEDDVFILKEDDDEESDEDEEQVEPIMSTPIVKQKQAEDRKSALKSGKSTDVKKKVDVSAAPTPEEVAPKPAPKKSVELEAPSKKVNEKKVPVLSKEQAPQQGTKRKAVANDVPSKHIKLDESIIVDEENKRRQERDERSLFIKGFPKNTKTKELEELHADIETVRHRRGSSFAWIVFRNEAACTKAHGTLSKAKVGGKNVIVDFCGSKSSKAPATPKELMPVNPLELYINGLPANVTKEDIRNVFRAAVSINIPKGRPHDLRRAFILFSTEEDAKLAFDKSKGLKLAGRSVEVFFARMRKDVLPNATVKPSKGAATASAKKPTAVPKVDESDDSDEEEVESSDEGIEELAESPAKQATPGKVCFL